ncbi:hypothetical protein AAG906_032955 [Vitis piasezkii]
MSSIELQRNPEIGMFAFYVSIPIDPMYTLANNSENMKKLVRRYSFPRSTINFLDTCPMFLKSLLTYTGIKYLFFTSLYEFMNEAMQTRHGFPPNTWILPLVSQAFEVWLDTRPVIAPNTRILPLVSRAFEIQEGTRLVYNILSCF